MSNIRQVEVARREKLFDQGGGGVGGDSARVRKKSGNEVEDKGDKK